MITALLTAALLLAAPTDAPSQQVGRDEPSASGRVVVGDGHLDIGPHLDAGRWRLAVRDDHAARAVWRDPSDVVIRVHDAARLTAPRDPQYAFLGSAQGRSVYVIPQTQNRQVVWTGWNTQDPEVVDAVGLGATFTLRGVRGPGQLHVFLQAGTGGAPDLLWTSGKRSAQPLFVESNTHTHANWVFTTPGVYLVDFEVSATLKSGRPVRDRRTLQFAVGDATRPATTVGPAPPPAATALPTAPPPARAEPTDDNGSTTWLVTALVAAAALGVGGLAATQGRARRRRAREILDRTDS